MSNVPSDIVDETGAVLRLGTFLGGGGEGNVWNIPTMPTMVAKVYHKPLTPDRAEKIRVMSGIGTASLSKLTAWPEKVLYRKAGQAIGLLIPKAVDAKDIHKLYSPKSRRTEFQRADWRFLVHAAANTARAFAAIHEAGQLSATSTTAAYWFPRTPRSAWSIATRSRSRRAAGAFSATREWRRSHRPNCRGSLSPASCGRPTTTISVWRSSYSSSCSLGATPSRDGSRAKAICRSPPRSRRSAFRTARGRRRF